MNDVDEINNINPMHEIIWDTLPEKIKEELFNKSEKLKKTGTNVLIGGAVLTGAGLILFIPAGFKDLEYNIDPNPSWVNQQLTQGVIVCGIGIVGVITGVIIRSVGSSRMRIYGIKHARFSFDLKSSRSCNGLSLVWRF